MSTNVDIQDKAVQVLEEDVPEGQQRNDLKDEKDQLVKTPVNDLVKNVNNKVLIEYLSPEISKNEASKRHHKYILISLLTVFLITQFVAIYIISVRVINYATSMDADIDIVNSLLTFVSAYITSVVIELVAILSYIVKNVFDTSLAELVKIFREDIKKEE